MSKNSNNSLTTASVLAFERKLDPSDALFYSGHWDDRDDASKWSAIAIREKSVRGTISNRLKTKDADPGKLDAAIENPNLQTVDVATLPATADTLKVRFTLRVLGGAGKPSACNQADYQARLHEVVGAYVEKIGFGELARRYAGNLANGLFLWRNRFCAETIQVRIDQIEAGAAKQHWEFDALSLSLDQFVSTPAVDSLAVVLESGLNGGAYVLLDVTAYARMGAGQEVFPSQELILDKSQSKKSKTLYDVDKIAAMHAQKIGNAIRQIDTWYSDTAEVGPIAVEPYGSVTSLGKAFRQPKEKRDFYSLLDSWMIKNQQPPLEQQHFVIATLIRGGVFGESGKD